VLFTGTLTDCVGLLLLTAVGWFIRAIVAVVQAVAIVAGRPDTPAGPATLPLVIATFCTQHSYQLGHVGVNNLPRVSKPSRSRWWSARERETLGGHTQWRSNGVGKMGKVQAHPSAGAT